MRMRKKKNLEPRMERCASIWEKDPYAQRGHWRNWMPDCSQLRLEIGCGKGSFTVDTAEANPTVLFIAVERVADAIVMAMERAMDKGLKNVVFVCDEAEKLTDMFAPDEVDLMYINFCDPWPGKKHAKRRLTYVDFLKSYRDLLKDGGQIHFKTDNKPLFDFSLTQFPRAGYALSEVTNDLHADDPNVIMTDYEARFSAEGTRINRCVATKAALPAPGAFPQEPELGLIHYLPQGQLVTEIPYGMAGVVEAHNLAVRRAAQRQENAQ